MFPISPSLPYWIPHVPTAVFSCGGLWVCNVVWWGLGWLRAVVGLVVPGALT